MSLFCSRELSADIKTVPLSFHSCIVFCTVYNIRKQCTVRVAQISDTGWNLNLKFSCWPTVFASCATGQRFGSGQIQYRAFFHGFHIDGVGSYKWHCSRCLLTFIVQGQASQYLALHHLSVCFMLGICGWPVQGS